MPSQSETAAPNAEPLTKEERESMSIILPTLGMLPASNQIATLEKWVRAYEATVAHLEAELEARRRHDREKVQPLIDRLEAEVARLAADREALTSGNVWSNDPRRGWWALLDPRGHVPTPFDTADEALAAYHASRSTTTEKNTNG